MATINPRTRDLATIHATIKQIGMDDDTYRQMLRTLTGKQSAADLNDGDRRRVIAHLRTLGGQFTRPRRSSGEWAFVDTAAPNNRPLLRKAIVLCRQLGLERGRQKAYCEGVMRRQHGVDRHMEMMNGTDLWMLVSALERTLRYKVKNQPAPEGGIAS